MHMQLTATRKAFGLEAGQPAHAEPGAPALDLRLFEGDRLREAVRGIGQFPDATAGRMVYVFLPAAIAWLPLVILNGLADPRPRDALCERVLYDLAGFAQFVLVLPLLIWSEFFIDYHAGVTGNHLVESGVVHDPGGLGATLQRVDRLRRSMVPDLVCLMGAYGISGLMIGTEIYGGSALSTWRTLIDSAGRPHLLPAAWWYGAVTLPLLGYYLLRWAWKLIVWSLYLRCLARADLRLSSGHPDHAGGLGALGEMQTKFGIVIFSVGLMIAATVLHRTVIEHHEFGTFNTMSIIVSYAIAAPVLFVAPLLSFTVRLCRIRRAGFHKYSEEASRRLWECEATFQPSGAGRREAAGTRQDMPSMQDLAICYSNVEAMRVMPLDFRSVMQLLGWALGPMLPLLPRFLPWDTAREILSKVLG